MNPVDWTEKYRPKRLSDIVGNRDAIRQLREWADEWTEGRPKKYPAVILAGKPGVGKTSAALALANEYGWDVVEMNASDVRSEERIKEIALKGALTLGFSPTGDVRRYREGGRKLIVLDEADNLYEGPGKAVDRGGKAAIIETIRRTQQPIVLIVNDLYGLIGGKGGALQSLCRVIKFRALNYRQVALVLKKICAAEGIKADREVLEAIARHAEGDVRAAIRDLQTVAVGRKVITMEDLRVLGWRDVTESVYQTVLEIFHGTTLSQARSSIFSSDEDPNLIMQWLDENLPLEYTREDDLLRAYEMLSRADVFLGRVRRRQHYRFWAYATDLMAGVSVAKLEKYKTHPRKYQYPAIIKMLGRSKSIRETRKILNTKIGRYMHTSHRVVKEDIYPYFREIYLRDMNFKATMDRYLRLDEKEREYLEK